jgi:hypothetical protein
MPVKWHFIMKLTTKVAWTLLKNYMVYNGYIHKDHIILSLEDPDIELLIKSCDIEVKYYDILIALVERESFKLS